MSTKEEIIQNIVGIPALFYSGGNKSFERLVLESGCNEVSELRVEDIANALLGNEGRVEDWLQWSLNKRVSSGWYFIKNDNKYCVGFLPDNDKFPTTIYESMYEACAAYILKEVLSFDE